VFRNGLRNAICALAVAAGAAIAQGPQPAGTNVKVLPWGVNTRQIMAGFQSALGVECAYCHVAGDFASDANPKKETARGMMLMMLEINYRFPDAKIHVTCYTCHRGQTEPKTAAPAP
jgi:photosynthetic reaction center cytochrome c subunit